MSEAYDTLFADEDDDVEVPEFRPAPPRRRRRLWLLIPCVLCLLFGGYIGLAHLSGGALPTLGMDQVGVGGDEATLRRTSLAFLENIQFKDFVAAGRYHAPDELDRVDVKYLLEMSLFGVKLESLKIIDYEVTEVAIDTSNVNARVHVWITYRHLARKEIREGEMLLYYKRDSPQSEFYMDLANSIYRPQGSPHKITR